MDIMLLLATFLAGAAYVLMPGPAFLALLGIVAAQGRRPGLNFVTGHLAGDIVWASLALTAIVGSASLGRLAFDLLGLVCGIYLFWLGWKAVRAKASESGEVDLKVERPLLRGIAFGLTNPKGYPVSVAMFTALLSGQAAQLTWSNLPLLLGAAFFGFIAADLILIAVIGLGPVRRLYARHALLITRATGVMFIGFSLQALWQAGTGLILKRV
ncbi:LysE family translocator [Ferrovibrio sp.]|uniref:LysE family translocator n=1 Tax=Ferrovibrio sp. TaxID=1917215 RepID=UPI003D2A15CB